MLARGRAYDSDNLMKEQVRNHRFIVDGRDRAGKALEPSIRAQVEGEFAELIQNATFLRRIVLRRQITAEVKRRLDEQAPPDALY